MKQRPEQLPDYRNPPIDEVVIGVQFPVIENLTENDIRGFWREVQQDYPLAETQPRLEGPIETADIEFTSPEQIFQQAIKMPYQSRLWLISADDESLVQLQNTRFIQNWRHRETDYERFEPIHGLFWENFRKFRDFLARNDIAQPVVQQVEVTYINWLPDRPLTDFFRPATNAAITISNQITEPADLNWNARYQISGQQGLIQRLYVQCQPAVRTRSPHGRGSQFALVFRTANAEGLSDEEIEAAVDSGRIIIVEAFTELTTEAAQTEWARFR